jgi:hypothetical protein
MTEIKSCVSCKHSVRRSFGFYYCSKFATSGTNYVTGEQFKNLKNCYHLRKSEGKCGPDAIGWEALEEKTFSQKVWNWFSK